MTGSRYEIEVLQTLDALEKLSADWSTLDQARRDPQLTHHWFGAAAATFHAKKPLRVVTVRRNDRLVAVAPLAEIWRKGIARLEIIGTSFLYEPSGLLAEDPAALARLCEAIVAEKRPLALMRVANDGAIAAALAGSGRGRGKLLTIQSPPSLRVNLENGWENYLASRKGEIRSGYLRRQRKLEAYGPVFLDSLRPSPDELAHVLEEAFDVEADGWKGEAGSAMRYNLRVKLFVSELARRFAASGGLRVSFLRAGGRAVAMNIDVEYDRCLWGVKTGYRESAHRASPGMLLLRETLRDACNRDLCRYEFLGCGDGSQSAWATGARQLQTILFYPYNLRGICALGLDVLSHFAKKLCNALWAKH